MKPLYVLGAIVAVGAGYGAYHQYFANPSKASLTKRDLPGLSISLPSGNEKSNLGYREGQVQLDDVAHSGAVLAVRWEPGDMLTDSDISMATNALLQMTHGTQVGAPVRGKGPKGEPVVTVHANSDKAPFAMSYTTCGARRLMIMTMGERMDELHQRVLASLDCHPDPKSDAEIGALPWVFDLPEGWSKHDAPAGQAQFTDGANAVLVRGLDKMPSHDDLRQILPPLMSAAGGSITLGDWVDDRLVMEGTLEGQHMKGFTMPVECPRGAVLVLAFSPDDAAAEKTHALLTAHGHCATSAVLKAR